MSRILSPGTFTVLCSLMCVVKCEEGRQIFLLISEKFLKLLIYNAFEAGINENNSLGMFYLTVTKIPCCQSFLPYYRRVKC